MDFSFKNFLNESVIKFTAWNGHGYVTVYIDGQKYVYNTDVINIPRIMKIAKFAPGRALSDLKTCSKLIEKPNNVKKAIQPEFQPIQKKLF